MEGKGMKRKIAVMLGVTMAMGLLQDAEQETVRLHQVAL